MVVKKKDVQNDRIDMTNIKMYEENQESRKLIDDTIPPIKPEKDNVNNIVDMKLSHVKNAPIMNCDKIKQPYIRSYKLFEGTEAFPTLQRDLRAWRIC